MKRLATNTIIVLATLGGLMLLWQFWAAIVLFALSLAVAAAVRPATDFGARLHLPRGLSILFTYLIVLAILTGLIVLVAQPLALELARATNQFVGTYEQITIYWPKGTAFQQAVASRLPPPEELYQAMAGDQGLALFRSILGVAQGFMSFLGQLVIVLVLSIYWSADQAHFERLLLSLLPARDRDQARHIWRSIEKGVGAYVRSELIQSLLVVILLGVGYSLIGLRYPIMLSISGAVFWLIPWLGAILAVILPLLAGLAISPQAALLAPVFTLAVLLIMEVVIEPRIFNRRRYSSLLVVLFVVALANLFGIIGIIIAPPLAAATQILARSLARINAPLDTTSAAAQLAALNIRLEAIRQKMSDDEKCSQEVESLANRVGSLIEEASQFMRQEPETPQVGLPVSSRGGNL